VSVEEIQEKTQGLEPVEGEIPETVPAA
jgi:hypothetical protein